MKIQTTPNYVRRDLAFGAKETNSAIIYANDTHGSMGTLPNMISGIINVQKELSKKSPLTFSAGDELVYANTLNASLENCRRQLLVGFFNMMNFDAITIGNHELNSGLKPLAELMEKAKFKFVSTNTKYENTPLTQLNKSDAIVKSMVIKNKDGEKYGILGLSPIDEGSSEIFGNVGDFIAGIPIDYNGPEDEIAKRIDARYEKTLNVLSEEIAKLDAKGINKIVLLSHLGYVRDKQIVKDPRINGVDIIIGGHSHDILRGFVGENDSNGKLSNVFKTPEGKPIVVVQAGSNANNFGVLDVFFDKSGVLQTDKQGEICGSNTIFNSEDFNVTPSISKHIDNILQKTFKDTPKIGIVKKPIIPITTRTRENMLLTATLDGFLELANKKGTDDIKKLDFAMINSSTVRASIPKGDLNEGLLSLVFAFAAPMSKVEASERQIVDTINAVLENGNLKGKYDIPQFSSNIQYEMIENVDCKGKKQLKLSKLSINGNEVDINSPSECKTYKAAVRDIFSDTKYFGDSFNSPAGEQVQRCCSYDGKPLDYLEGLADYLRNHCVNPKTKEITFDTEPKNITVMSSNVSFSGRKSLIA